MWFSRQPDGRGVRCGVRAWPPSEEEAAQESDNFHSRTAGGAGEGFWENPLPRHLHPRGVSPEDQTDWGQGPGTYPSIHPSIHLSSNNPLNCLSTHPSNSKSIHPSIFKFHHLSSSSFSLLCVHVNAYVSFISSAWGVMFASSPGGEEWVLCWVLSVCVCLLMWTMYSICRHWVGATHSFQQHFEPLYYMISKGEQSQISPFIFVSRRKAIKQCTEFSFCFVLYFIFLITMNKIHHVIILIFYRPIFLLF